MGGIASIFGGGPKMPSPPDFSAQRAAEAKAKKESDDLKAQQEEDERAIRTGRRGRRSLLSPEGGELGFANILGG